MRNSNTVIVVQGVGVRESVAFLDGTFRHDFICHGKNFRYFI